MKKIIVILVLAGLGYFAYTKYNEIQALEFLKIENVKLSNLSGPPDFSVQLDVDTYWNNPNSMGAHITSMDFDVDIDEQFVTNIKEQLDVKVPANNIFTLPISVTVPLLKGNLLKNASELLTGAWKKREVDVHLVGTIKVKTFEMNIPIPFDINTKIRIADYL